MSPKRKTLRAVLTGKTVPWLLLLLLIPCMAILLQRERSAVTAGANENISIYYSPNKTASQENETEDPGNSRNIKNYTIRLHNGAIAIFEDGSSRPLYTADTPASRLPAADRLLLENGIRAETLTEAYRMIEDYE